MEERKKFFSVLGGSYKEPPIYYMNEEGNLVEYFKDGTTNIINCADNSIKRNENENLTNKFK